MSPFDIPMISDRETADSPIAQQKRIAYLQALHEISQTILESQDLSVMTARILEQTLETGGFEIGLIHLLNPLVNSLEPVTSRGYRDLANVERQRKRAEDPTSPRVIAQVMQTKQTKIDDLEWTEGMRTFKREGVRTMVTVPLRTVRDVLGIMHLGSRAPRAVAPEEIRLLETIGFQAGIAVQKLRLLEAAGRRAKEQEPLSAIAAGASRSLDLNELFQAIADKTVEVIGRPRINFRHKDPLSGEIKVVAHRGFTDLEIETLRRVAPHPMVEQVFASGEPVVINDRAGRGSSRFLGGTQVVAWIPIKAGARVVGVFTIADDQARPFLPSEVGLLQAIANQMGMAMQRAQLYEETKRQARALEEIIKMQADFTAMIAHDLRSPLLNISGTVEVMMNGMFGHVNDEQKHWLGRMLANSHDLVKLVSDFLDMSKLEAGYVDLVKEKVDLPTLFAKSLESYLILAQKKQIFLTSSIDPSMPRIEADPRRLDQVVSNLLANAIQFTPKGGSIEVGAKHLKDGGVKIWVKDNGVGISEEDMANLFEKYRQCNNLTVSGHKGTGLGLLICKMVVQAHGGKIWCESAEGKGSSFFFSLPATT